MDKQEIINALEKDLALEFWVIELYEDYAKKCNDSKIKQALFLLINQPHHFGGGVRL